MIDSGYEYGYDYVVVTIWWCTYGERTCDIPAIYSGAGMGKKYWGRQSMHFNLG